MKPECRHIMPSGKQCHAYALRDEFFCYFHARLHRAAKQPVSLIDSVEIPLLEDRCAVQLTITRVLRAFANKTIDRPSASTLLYGLQLALQSVDQTSWAIGIGTVEGLSETPDGDEIAFDPDEDLEDDEDETDEEEEENEEEGEEEEALSDAASNPHHEGAGDSVDENNPENVEAEEDENESTEQLIATLNQLKSVSRALELGDLRPLRACLASAADG
ncbi:MAG TPA: hypothetical protein VJX73_15340 [Terracidiphilus sp.]|nr:hypothetical protein [Terracidiphilus sp.]